MVEEEGPAVGEADVLVGEVFASRGFGGKSEDLVVVLVVFAFWHGWLLLMGKVEQKVRLYWLIRTAANLARLSRSLARPAGGGGLLLCKLCFYG